jgi:RHS repeat-associated protein
MQRSCAPAVNSFQTINDYILGPGGDQVTEINGAGQWQHSNVFSAARLTATYDYNGGNGGLHFELADPLGTKRVQANIYGQIEMSWVSLPFGDALTPIVPPNPPSTADDATEHHFTQKERDSESNNDYFFARYYNSAIGRFTTPDWSAKEEPVPYAVFTDPQSLNLYAYVDNNPLIHVDADGHDDVRIVNEQTGAVTIIIPVRFKGRGATPERIHQIVNRVDNLSTGDNHTRILLIPTKKKFHGVLNKMDISAGPNAKMCGAAGECTNKVGGNKAHIDANKDGPNDAGPHEIMHFAGMNEGYETLPAGPNGERRTQPLPGYEDNVMGTRSGTQVNQQQLNDVNTNGTTKHCISDKGKITCN